MIFHHLLNSFADAFICNWLPLENWVGSYVHVVLPLMPAPGTRHAGSWGCLGLPLLGWHHAKGF